MAANQLRRTQNKIRPGTPRRVTTRKEDSGRAKVIVKNNNKGSQKQLFQAEIEKKYSQVFNAFPLPYHGVYTDDDSLEQPSALKYVPTNSSPAL